MKCENCHWFIEERMKAPTSDGKIYPCSNIGVPGWEQWAEKQTAPEDCDDYCKQGEYVPTGIWAGVATVVKQVGELVEKDGQK